MEKIIFSLAIGCLLFVSCGHSQEHEGHLHGPKEPEHEENEALNPDAVFFSKQQQEKTGLLTELPVIEPFGQIIKATARIQSSQSDETILSARTSGIVVFSGNNLTEGQNITPGQPLFTISGAGLAENNAGIRFVEAQNNYVKAEADYKRAQSLIKDKIIPEKDFIQIKGTYETARAVYDNWLNNFGSQGQKVAGSFAGYLKQIYVENGQYVEEGQALVSISKNKSLLLKADVQPKYAGLLPFISSATIRSMDKTTVYSLEELNGKVLSFGKSLNDENYLIPVSFQIDNKAGFLPEGFVEVFIKIKSGKPVMTIPASALTEAQGNFFVYVQTGAETFEKREVMIGMTDGIRVEILSGLNKEEQTVIKGAMSVKLAQSTGTLDPHAGHTH
jgi:RND family efflux transporter MFP subunit